MEKRYSMLTRDKVFDSNIILDYDHHGYEQRVHDDPQSMEDCATRPSRTMHYVDTTGLRGNLQSDESRKKGKDFLLDSLNVDEYHAVQNCVISNSIDNMTVSITDSKPNHGESKQSVGLNSSINLCDDLRLTKRTENGIVIETHGENGAMQPCLSSTNYNKHDQECLEKSHVSSANFSTTKSLQQEDTQAEIGSNNCFIEKNHNISQSKQGGNKDALDVKFMEKGEDIELHVGTLEEHSAVSNNETVDVLATEEGQNVAVGSNLQFLNTGDSIVVLTQDANNLGLSANMGDIAVTGDKQIDLGQYEFSAGPTDINTLSGALTESQPTFFQVELYSTCSLQNATSQVPATVISAQQVLTVPQLFSCYWEACNTHFLSKEDLVGHVTTQHAKPIGPQEYRCLWKGCTRDGKIFDARYKILTHLRSHTGERPHVCLFEGCHKSFARLDNLKIHTRSHTGERPYTCPYEGCNKSYANSSDRFKHTRTHLEKKPYRCRFEGCDKSYTDPSSLRKHQKRHKNGRSKIILDVAEPVTVLSKVSNDGEVTCVVSSS